jgi:hypothetical protein
LAKTDASGNRLNNGAMAQMAEMVMAGYMRLVHSSNLGIKYAYTLSSSEVLPLMQQVGETDEILFRTKLSSSRFFREDTAAYQNIVAQLFGNRLQNGDAIQDIADIYGKIIDVNKIKTAIALQVQ